MVKGFRESTVDRMRDGQQKWDFREVVRSKVPWNPFFVLGTRGGTIFRRGNRNGITADHKTLLSLFSPMSSKGRNHLCWHTRGNGGTHFFLFREPPTSKMFGPIFRTNCPGDRCRYPSSNERIYGCVFRITRSSLSRPNQGSGRMHE